MSAAPGLWSAGRGKSCGVAVETVRNNGLVTQFGLPALASEPRRVIVLGSTGSVGTRALAVIAAHPAQFHVVGLAAGGSRAEVLAAQAAAYPDARVAVADAAVAAASGAARSRLLAGPGAATDLVIGTPADVVLNAIDGPAGLGPSLAALGCGTILALANKHSLVAGGPLVTAAAAPGQIVPVGLAQSALAQCLRAGDPDEVAGLVLTASGGPFCGSGRARLEEVTVAEALAGPPWQGSQVTRINSATLVDKGLELIEAHLLFGVPYRRIQVVVHPQSVVHSMVTFTDGATVAQTGPPGMALPIALGLSWPRRLAGAAAPVDVTAPARWTFEPVDHDAFPALGLARAAGIAGGMVPAAYNAANQQAVAAFIAGALPFPGIAEVLERTLEKANDVRSEPGSVQDVMDAESWARTRAGEIIGSVMGAR